MSRCASVPVSLRGESERVEEMRDRKGIQEKKRKTRPLRRDRKDVRRERAVSSRAFVDLLLEDR